MKQRYIAKQVHVNENTLRNWMTGDSWPRLDQAVKLATILHCNVTDLYKEVSNHDVRN